MHCPQHRGVAEQIEPLGLTATRHRDDARSGAVRQELDNGFDPVLLRHVKVGDDQVAAMNPPQAKRFHPIAGLGDLVPFPAQQDVKRAADAGIVIDDQYPWPSCCGHSVSLSIVLRGERSGPNEQVAGQAAILNSRMAIPRCEAEIQAVGCDSIAASGVCHRRYCRHSGRPTMGESPVGLHKHLYSQAVRSVRFFDKNHPAFGLGRTLYRIGIKEDAKIEMMARSVPIGVVKRTPTLEPA